MSDNKFCESCGAPLTPGQNVCSACGQPVRTTGSNDISAESWSKPTPSSSLPPRDETDRWGSPISDIDQDSPQRWGSPQPNTVRDNIETAFPSKPEVTKKSKTRKWILIIVLILIGLCICVIAAGIGGYALFNGT